MLPLPRLAPHLPRSFDPLYNRVQLLYNRHNNSQNYLLQQQQPHLLRSNYAFIGGQNINNNNNYSPLGGAHFCTVNHQFNHQINNEHGPSSSSSTSTTAGEAAAELNLEQYYDQVKSKLQNNEINFQRPVNNLKFVEYENLFAYNVLKASPEYERTVGAVLASAGTSSGQPFWPANLAELIFEPEQQTAESGFQKDALESLKAQIHSMNAAEVIRFQKYLLGVIPFCADERDWERIFYQSAFCSVWQALDGATVNLLANTSLSSSSSSSSSSTLYELLAISGLWFEMGLAKDVAFNRALLRRLLQLSTEQQQQLQSKSTSEPEAHDRKVSLMHLTFALNLSRSVEPSQVNSLVTAVSAYLDEAAAANLSLDELSVVAMGFFKTKTRMPQHLLGRFIALCSEQFESVEAAEFGSRDRTDELSSSSSSPSNSSPPTRGPPTAFTSTIAVASALKLIRFSLETAEFDARTLREPVRTLVDRICAHHSGALLDSNICLTHLILLLNSAYLQNCRRLYKTIFDRMIGSLEGFRIKDIERVLFCLANVYFVCPNFKLKALEDYLVASEESQLYPYHVYNITYYLLVLNFFPHRLIGLCADPAFLERAVDSFKLKLTDTLLITDTILRLETQQPRRQILSAEQHVEYHREQMISSERSIPATTKRARFLRATRDILAGEAAYADRLRLMYLFPFAKYPFPVLLSPQAARFVPAVCPATENIFHDAVPYRLEQLVADGRDNPPSFSFRGSTAILVLVNKDKTYGSNLRGFTLVNKRLLERLGFRVVLIEQRDYPDLVLPRHLFQPTSPRYLQSVEQLLASVAQAETKTTTTTTTLSRRRSDDHHPGSTNRQSSR